MSTSTSVLFKTALRFNELNLLRWSERWSWTSVCVSVPESSTSSLCSCFKFNTPTDSVQLWPSCFLSWIKHVNSALASKRGTLYVITYETFLGTFPFGTQWWKDVVLKWTKKWFILTSNLFSFSTSCRFTFAFVTDMAVLFSGLNVQYADHMP